MPGYEGGAGKLIFVARAPVSSPGRGIRKVARLPAHVRGEVAEWLKAARPYSEHASAILRPSAEKWPSG